MGSIIAMSRTASLKIKNAAKAAKKTMSVRRSRGTSRRRRCDTAPTTTVWVRMNKDPLVLN